MRAIIIMGQRGSGKTTLEYNLRRLLVPNWPNEGPHSLGEDVCFIGPCRNPTWMLSGGAEKLMREKWIEPPPRDTYIFTGTTGEANNVKAHEFVKDMEIHEFVLETPEQEEWMRRLDRRPRCTYIPPRRNLKSKYPGGKVVTWEEAWSEVSDLLGIDYAPLTLEEIVAEYPEYL